MMSKTDKFIDISDRDWLSVSSGVGMSGDDPAFISDDISTLSRFLEGEPIAIKEIRAVVVRILHSGWDTLGIGKNFISMLFDQNHCPHCARVWTVDFKRTDGGQSNPRRDTVIAAMVRAVRDCGKSYNEAIEWAAEHWGISTRRVQQIYREHKDKFSERVVNVKNIKKKLKLKD
jgi:hypothetical protein